jgi:Na+/phosphate symporter
LTTLLNLLAAIALLVWGTHIVRTGVLRVYGAALRRVPRRSMSGRATASFRHPNLLDDFKRINSLFCSVAYPILESAGVLSKTRLLNGEPAPFASNETRTT